MTRKDDSSFCVYQLCLLGNPSTYVDENFVSYFNVRCPSLKIGHLRSIRNARITDIIICLRNENKNLKALNQLNGPFLVAVKGRVMKD